MNKWGELIKYLNSKKAKPEAVMNMVKAVYDRKSTVAPERTAWKFNVIVGIIHRPEKAIDGSIEHFTKKLEATKGPKVVKTFE